MLAVLQYFRPAMIGFAPAELRAMLLQSLFALIRAADNLAVERLLEILLKELGMRLTRASELARTFGNAALEAAALLQLAAAAAAVQADRRQQCRAPR